MLLLLTHLTIIHLNYKINSQDVIAKQDHKAKIKPNLKQV